MSEEVEGFLAKYSDDIADQLRLARAKLRELFPNGYELVYDNCNALAFGYAATERASDAIISLAGYPRWITLFFLNGASLGDPQRLLQGSGSRVRSIRLASPADLDRGDVSRLIEDATAPHRASLLAASPLTTLVKSVSDKQRPRRPVGEVKASPKPRTRHTGVRLKKS